MSAPRWAWWLIGLLLAPSLLPAQRVPGHYIVELTEDPVFLAAAKSGAPRLAAADRRAAVRRQQREVRRRLAGRRAVVYGSVERVANALLVKLPDERAEAIAAVPGIKRVRPVRWIRLSLDRALSLHHVPQAWANLGGQDLAGAGMKIGIIDTGIDAAHPAFRDSSLPMPDGFPRVNQQSDLEFTSNKVIVARSYLRLLDSVDDISARDTEGHGTAVAMAAAGMPVATAEGFVSGVAPKAYLGSYNVFDRRTGQTRNDVVLKAFDDAIADGMDVINLSLGSVFAMRPQDELFTAAAERAEALGTVVVVAAGNDGPEPFTISDFGVAPGAITVGATWNDRIFSGSVRLASGEQFRAVPGSGPRPAQPLSAPLVDLETLDPSGLACNPLPAGTLTGRIPLILRGTCLFEDKLNNVRVGGAVAALVYTDQARPDPITMSVGNATLPAVMVGYEDGRRIKQLLAVTPDLRATIDFRQSPFAVDPRRVADFSSAGPATDFAIKPDLVATGTAVRTAAVGGGFQVAQGTSFSSPIVAGAAAALKGARPGYPASHYRSLLINTAQPLLLPSGRPAPVRQVGGGVLNLEAALNATLTVSPTAISFGTTTGEAVRQLTIFNLSTSERVLALELQPFQGGPLPALSSTSVRLGPLDSRTITLRMNSQGAAPGEYQGYLYIRGAAPGTDIHVPYWQAVPSSVPAFLKILDQIDSGAPGSLLREAIAVRVTDAAGVPLREPQPTVTVVSGGGSVVSVTSADNEVPGLFVVNVRLGPQAGNNVFRIEAGSLSREVTIAGR